MFYSLPSRSLRISNFICSLTHRRQLTQYLFSRTCKRRFLRKNWKFWKFFDNLPSYLLFRLHQICLQFFINKKTGEVTANFENKFATKNYHYLRKISCGKKIYTWCQQFMHGAGCRCTLLCIVEFAAHAFWPKILSPKLDFDIFNVISPWTGFILHEFLAIFWNEITTILTPSTSEEGEWGRWVWSRFSFWRYLITNPEC